MSFLRRLKWYLGLGKELECPECRMEMTPRYDYDSFGCYKYECRHCGFGR